MFKLAENVELKKLDEKSAKFYLKNIEETNAQTLCSSLKVFWFPSVKLNLRNEMYLTPLVICPKFLACRLLGTNDWVPPALVFF